MDSLPNDVKSQLTQMQGNLRSLEAALAPFLNKSPSELETQLDALPRAQMYQTLSHAAVSLFTMYLKTKGIDPTDHAFNKEEGRLKQYNKKVRKLAAEAEIRKSKRTLEVDVASMSRFIAATVPDLSVQQKEALKKVGKEANSKKKDQKRIQEEQGIGGSMSAKKVKKKDAALAFLHDALDEVKSTK